MTDAYRHSGRTIVLTGGSQGIGQAIAERLLDEGARLCILDRVEPQYAAFASARERGAASWYEVDLARAGDVRRVCANVVADVGVVYGVVHAAAYQQVIPFGEISADEWDRTLSVNVSAAFHLVQAVAPSMILSRRGRVIFITSSSLYAPPPGLAHYVTSKGALVGLVRALSHEFGPDGITVNAVAPGLTRTPNAVATIPPELFDAVVAGQAIKRSGEPRDQAGLVSFLLSDDADFITGQTILADGGESHL